MHGNKIRMEQQVLVKQRLVCHDTDWYTWTKLLCIWFLQFIKPIYLKDNLRTIEANFEFIFTFKKRVNDYSHLRFPAVSRSRRQRRGRRDFFSPLTPDSRSEVQGSPSSSTKSWRRKSKASKTDHWQINLIGWRLSANGHLTNDQHTTLIKDRQMKSMVYWQPMVNNEWTLKMSMRDLYKWTSMIIDQLPVIHMINWIIYW